MTLSSVVVGAALVVAATAGLPALPASAAHPCAQSPDGAQYDPNFTSDHDACGGGLPEARPGDVRVTEADSGATVVVPLGARLLVALDSGYDRSVWSEVAAGSALHRSYLDVQRPRTSAVFDALRASDGERLTATGPAAWSVMVVVPSPSTTASPGPSPDVTPCRTVRTPAAFESATVLTDADNGRTVQVYRGDKVGAFFTGCTGTLDYQPAISEGPLSRYRARGHNPGGASAVFSATATGTATITSTTDAPCLHTSPACAPPQQQWRATVNVIEHCELTGPARVTAGSETQLTGRFAAGSTVQVLFRQYGASAFTVRRTLTADSGGYVRTSYRALVDQRWYATGSQGCTSQAGLTQIDPQITGPAVALRGSAVPVTVTGPAGATVQVWFNKPGTSYVVRRTGRISADGVYRTSYTADVDHRYYALTGPDRRTTTPTLTKVR